MQIKEVEEKTGLERSSIRFYESEGLIHPKRLENGYREYGEEDLQALYKIKLLRSLGATVEEVKEVFSEGITGIAPESPLPSLPGFSRGMNGACVAKHIAV